MTEPKPGTTMAKPSFSLREDDLVTLLVGLDEQKFVVHKSCITRTSDFSKAAMKEEWTEGQTRIVKLPEETCIESFLNYLNYAYHKKLPTEDVQIRADGGFAESPYGELANIYVIGERMLDQSLKNAVAREYARLASIQSSNGSHGYPGQQCITRIYEGTTRGSPMRRMMVDFAVTHGNAQWPYKGQHTEFLEELTEQLQRKIMAQKEVRDFRLRDLVAEDYFV